MSNDKTPSDSELFRNAVGDVTPVENRHVQHKKPKPSAHPKQFDLDEKQVMDDLLSENFLSETIEAEEHLEFRRPGIQHKTMRRLKRGEYRADAEIDLHGLTADNARKALTGFLHDCKAHGWRCVTIIHGKGLGSFENEAVLKSRVNTWLRHFGDVLAFCSATPRDGGTGAVYVLVKRGE